MRLGVSFFFFGSLENSLKMFVEVKKKNNPECIFNKLRRREAARKLGIERIIQSAPPPVCSLIPNFLLTSETTKQKSLLEFGPRT